MRINAGALICADGTVLRNVTLTCRDGIVSDIAPGYDFASDYSYGVVTPVFHNGHSHTEYHLLKGTLPSGQFFSWVRDLVRLKTCIPNYIWSLSTVYGVSKLLEMGYASTEDCCESGFAPYVMTSLGLSGACYQEVNGLNPLVDAAKCVDIIKDIHPLEDSLKIGLAPHAIYSTCQPVINVVSELASHLSLCIHVDESREEDSFCRRGDGPFVDMYRRRGIVHSSPCSSALQYFDKNGLVRDNTLLVHGCNWDDADIALVRSNNARVAICPESNQYLSCNTTPILKLYGKQIRIVIGTDSAVSCVSMSPIKQLLSLMSASNNSELHRWLFHAQVTPESGKAYDICVGMPANFCGYDFGMPMLARTLHETLRQISCAVPHVYRNGQRMQWQLKSDNQSNLESVVKALAIR